MVIVNNTKIHPSINTSSHEITGYPTFPDGGKYVWIVGGVPVYWHPKFNLYNLGTSSRVHNIQITDVNCDGTPPFAVIFEIYSLSNQVIGGKKQVRQKDLVLFKSSKLDKITANDVGGSYDGVVFRVKGLRTNKTATTQYESDGVTVKSISGDVSIDNSKVFVMYHNKGGSSWWTPNDYNKAVWMGWATNNSSINSNYSGAVQIHLADAKSLNYENIY